MRRRPEVKVYLDPPVVSPGEELVAETVLVSRSETPIDFVEMRLSGTLRSAAGAGNGRRVHQRVIYARVFRTDPHTLEAGERRYRVSYTIDPDAPPSYRGADAAISYELEVHVSIPWWPDRRRSFVVPVACNPFSPGEDPRPAIATTPNAGAGGLTMEAALDGTDLARGEALRGSVSIQNPGKKAIRGIDVTFVEVESVSLPYAAVRERARHTHRVLAGAPSDGEAVSFRVRVPDRATPTFEAGPIRLTTHVEIRAHVAWGSDAIVRVPVMIAPAKRRRARPRRIAPVGRDRIALLFREEATRSGLAVAADGDGVDGARGAVRLRIRAESRDGVAWLVAELAWPSLGLDLDVGERRWTDVLSLGRVVIGTPSIDERLSIQAREHVQARAALSGAALEPLLVFDSIEVGDEGATLASKGGPRRRKTLGAFVDATLRAAEAWDGVQRTVPPPALLVASLPSWRMLAESLSGRLELGRMWIHDGRMKTDSVSIGCVWSRRGLLLGIQGRVAIDPPLGAVPASPDEPSISPRAREAWRALARSVRDVRVERDAISIELGGESFDPAGAPAVLELAVALRRALTGGASAGPFR